MYFVVLYLTQVIMINIGFIVFSSVSVFIRNSYLLAIHGIGPSGWNPSVITSSISYATALLSHYPNYIYLPTIYYPLDKFLMLSDMLFYHALLSIILGWYRLLIVVIFVIVIVSRPFHAILTVYWLRLTEAKTPFFTFLFAGMAAVANFVVQLGKFVGGSAPN
jgi:hypothetical protein